jgi:hypothetical protein
MGTIMIVQQCHNCGKKGKNVYCNNCIKSADYFHVYKYTNSNRFDKGRLIGKIKAYTWHDATEYVKNSYFSNRSKESLNINCEKDFAYLEQNLSEFAKVGNNEAEKESLFGYKIYLNKEESESSFIKDAGLWDLNVDITVHNDSSPTVNIASEVKQTVVAAAIEPNPSNQLTPNTPTMITRSNNEDKKKEKD